VKLYQVDAFTAERFSGNPAAVCLVEGSVDDGWMQDVAREMNLSETAFLTPSGKDYKLRWFTPLTEVDLCGHATLASAHVLWTTGAAGPDEVIRFETRSGVLSAVCRGDWTELDFPATPEEEAECNVDIERALGVPPVYVGRSTFDFLVELPTESVVRDLEPDLAIIERANARGVIVTARARSDEYDFVSRFFAPQCGVPEDPVTGSAHCCLGPYWARRLGKDDLVGYQASPRGGTVRVHVQGDRVALGGRAVTVFEGELH